MRPGAPSKTKPRTAVCFGSRFLALGSRRLVEVTAQLFAQVRVAQLAQRHGLDLPDALARDAKLDAYFFKRAIAAILQAITQLDNLALALGQLLQHFFDLL